MRAPPATDRAAVAPWQVTRDRPWPTAATAASPGRRPRRVAGSAVADVRRDAVAAAPTLHGARTARAEDGCRDERQRPTDHAHRTSSPLPACRRHRPPGAPARPAAPPGRPAPRPAHRARPHGDDPVVDCAVYVDGHRQAPRRRPRTHCRWPREQRRLRLAGAATSRPRASSSAIAGRYGLHPLAVEDAVYAHQRPKLERYDDALFMVLKTATYVEHEELTATSEVVDTGEVMVFLGAALRDHRPARRSTAGWPSCGTAWRSSATCCASARPPSSTPSPTWWSTHFVEVAADVEEDVDELEASVFSPDAHRRHRPRLYQLKRELMQLRRAVSPLEVPLHEAGRAAGRRRPRGDALLLPRRAGPRHPGARPGRLRSTSCCPRSCRPRWPAPRWPTTRTCARSPPGPASSPSPPRSPASTG